MEEPLDIALSRKQIEQARKAPNPLQGSEARVHAPHETIRIHVLASGSKGNATLVQNARTGQGFLIDCGICKRDVLARCEEAGFELSGLKGILITHEHTDHTKGLKVLCKELMKRGVQVPLFVNESSFANSKQLQEAARFVERKALYAEDQLSLAGMQVYAFATSHDATCSFGFRIWDGNDAAGFMTDTGKVTGAAHEALQDCRIVAIEANHDPAMLKNGPYPRSLQERVASDFGHLSNGQCAEELKRLLHPGLQDVIAMHISENNNTYRLPVECLRDVLKRENHSGEAVCAYQQRLVSR